MQFRPGQRWISEGEPELGLGVVREVLARTLRVAFPASGEVRQYARESAPLRRVAFRKGDTLHTEDHATWVVQEVREREGLLHYDCGSREVCESELDASLRFSGPQDRLIAGHWDPSPTFDLRLSALKVQHQRRKSEVRGFLGGRIDLLPHQLGLAAEVTGRLLPRVLLADEVGLGKTIEACLILHRLLATGRAKRILILVPESLVHQWFVELLRRFNLWFHIYDEGRCQALEASSPGCNPFWEDQLILCDLGLVGGSPARLAQALDADWDLLVIDEAHHLAWSPEAASPDYRAVEALGQRAEGLLLLTATPEQLGMASHFARLRLLDPARFFDLATFLQEAAGYREIAALAQSLQDEAPLTAAESERLGSLLGLSKEALQAGRDSREAWIQALRDQHGTGRVMFRHTRATVTGFPRRVPHLYPLEPAGPALSKTLAEEWDSDSATGPAFQPKFARDPRLPWLADLLKQLGSEKVLLICHSRAKAEAIHAALGQRLKVKMAVFHEGLSLVQRDRGAAWFAEAGGARLLLCSEIGSEGRNFQFAHHLVLFDLPLDPAVLEQRMGRLDRIGQTSEIQLHIPYVMGTHQEVLARWYQEGLNAFAENLPGGQELLERFEPTLRLLAAHPEGGVDFSLGNLIEASREARQEVATRLEAGRDRLLEAQSHAPERALALIQEIQRLDASPALEAFLLAVLDQYLIPVEALAPRTYQLGSAEVLVDAFPGLPSEGLTLTFDRQRALLPEDVHFLSWDHPLISGALDLVLGSEQGNCSAALWPDQASALYLESVFLLECLAPSQLHVDRFLPPTPIRILLDHRLRDVGNLLPHAALRKLLRPLEGPALLQGSPLLDTLLPQWCKQAEILAQQKGLGLVAKARQVMAAQLDGEIARLRSLQRVNPSVRGEEIEALVQQRAHLDQALKQARVRLDALRLIQRGQPGHQTA